MKIIKNIIVCSLFFTLYTLNSQEEKKPSELAVTPVTSTKVSPTEATKTEATKTEEKKTEEEKKPSELKPESKEISEKPTTEGEQIKTETKPEAKSEGENILQPWKDHLKKLLEKGALWNEANNIPSDDWKSEAFTLAKNSIEKDKTVANELKSSFETTVNEKITLENSTSNQASTEFITTFNNYIDELIKPKEEVKTEPEKPAEPEEKKEEEKAVITQEASVEETPALAGLMTESSQPAEVTPPITSEATPEKPQESAQDSWINYLKNISKEVSNAEFIKNAHKKAYDLISSLPPGIRNNALNKIREDFQKALEYQASQQYIPNMQKIVQEFSKGFEESALQQGFGMPPAMDISQQQVKREEFGPSFMVPPQGPMEMVGKERVTEQQYFAQPAVSIIEEEIKKSPDFRQPYQITIEKKDREQELSQQQALNQDVMTQMKQKTTEKEQEKNIVSQLMQTVFNIDIDKWFKTSKEEQIRENIPDVIETILNKERNIKEKNIKKNAYLSFQNTLLSFNSNKFWDNQNKKPNQEWINKIQNELMVLIHYKMITIDQALYIIDNVLKFDNKVSEFNRINIINNIRKFLHLELSTPYTLYENNLPLRPLIALLY